ncbi:MAG: hypothetical protein KDN22_13475, partial [Verrucomicrobiae bacterium]|nr:hypothetical protein [Verrucomicrobiae bacterium]
GEIEWPRPELTMMAIYPVYGYENQILLPVSITPPASLDPKTDREVTLEAAASWMCCGKTCHPGFTTVKITLPTVGKEEKLEPTAARPLFIEAREALPLKTDAWNITASTVEGKVIAQVVPASGGPANLEILKASAADVYFFSSDGLIDSRATQEISDLPGAVGFRIILSIFEHAPEFPKDGGRLEGVLSAKIPWISGTAPTAIEINVPLQR